MKATFIKIVVWIPALVIAMFIFGFSSQDGESSGGLSRQFAIVAVEIVDVFSEVPESEYEEMVDMWQLPIRKAAHMTEYALLAVCVYMALFVDGIRKRQIWWMALTASFLFAAGDEFHQLFVPGRCGAPVDVMIDFAGACIGVGMVVAVSAIIKRHREQTNLLKNS